MKSRNLKKYIYEFISVFFAISFAFLLDRWNDNRKERISEKTILTEIYNGLGRDSLDLQGDEFSIKYNIGAISYFRRIVDGISVDEDSLNSYYFLLTRDFLTVQNTSGYETLKSSGLEIIEDDSLRKSIIELYEVEYKLFRKFTEEYDENQYMRNYFTHINNVIAPYFVFGGSGNLIGIDQPIPISQKEKNLVKSYLLKLYINRYDRQRSIIGNKERIAEIRAQIREQLQEKAGF